MGDFRDFASGTLTAAGIEYEHAGACNHILHSTVSRRFTMSDQGRQVAKVATLMAGGAVIGAGIGLLFAPQTGAETRRDVSRYAKKAQLQATRWSRTVQSGVKEVMDCSKALIRKDEQKPRIEAA
jgi:gas vesicle protein